LATTVAGWEQEEALEHFSSPPSVLLERGLK
jgi:hypothetical protein